MAIEKILILGAHLELPAKQPCHSSPFTSKTDFDLFFNCHGCRTFFLVEIHCYLSALKFDIITYSKAVCLPWMDCDKFFSRSNIHQNSRTISTLMNLPMNFEGFIGVEIWFASAASLNRTLHIQNMMFGYMTIKIIKLFGTIFAITIGAYLTR